MTGPLSAIAARDRWSRMRSGPEAGGRFQRGRVAAAERKRGPARKSLSLKRKNTLPLPEDARARRREGMRAGWDQDRETEVAQGFACTCAKPARKRKDSRNQRVSTRLNLNR